MSRSFSGLAGLALVCLAAGCAPRLSPLTRDYRLAASDTAARTDVRERLAAALTRAGWTALPAGGDALTTEPRAGADWGLYDVRLSLDAIPIAEGRVRLVFDPVRRYVWRTRTHIPYLPAGALRTFLPSLDAALRAEGFVPDASGAARDLGRRANRVDS